MNRMLGILLAGSMLISLTACSKTGETSASAAAAVQTTAEETVMETTAAPATTAETARPGETASAEDQYEKTADWFELSEDLKVLTVRLPANATTGYQWSYKIQDPAALEEITSEYIEEEHAEGMTGVGGTWVASFRVPEGVETDETFGRENDLRFTYSRSWEGEGIPSRTLDLLLRGQEIEITEIHEPDFDSALKAEDGTYPVKLSFSDMQEQSELSFYGLVGLPETVTLTEEDVKVLKVGDVIPLSQYGLIDLQVTKLEKREDGSILIDDAYVLVYSKELGAWTIVDWDNDVCSRITEKRLVHFTNETVIEDGVEEVIKSGNTGTIYDKMKAYLFVDADITVKDGEVQKIRIHYHS